MPSPSLTWEQRQEALDAYALYGSEIKAAAALGIPRTTLQGRLREARVHGHAIGCTKQKPAPEFEIPPLPDDDLSADELIAHRIKQFGRKRAYEEARKIIPVKVKIDGPIGIWHCGDPHIDDDGTDIEAIKRDTELIRTTPGLFGANVGDVTNNWIGRLARLWADQSTSARQAWKIAEWFLRRVDWLYLIGGNHDAWSGAGDPITWIQRGQTAPYSPSEVRLELRFPNGNTCRINARHDFAGHSQYNPAHGVMKATMFGVRDHIGICGHKHTSGHGILKNPDDGSCCHLFQVASYKQYDRYQMERGFRDQRISPGVFTLIDPSLPNTHPDFILPCWSIERGIQILQALRKG